MIHVSDRFKAAIANSYTAASRCELWSEGSFVREIPIISGSVTVDTGQQFRRQTTDLVVPKDTYTEPLNLIPESPQSQMAPNGNELRLFRGILYDDGTEELCPIGVLNTAQTQVDDSGQGISLTVTAYDRSRRISRALLTKPMLFAAGASCVDVIYTVTRSQAPWLSERHINLATTGQLAQPALPPLYYKVGDDPWKAMSQLATCVGGELYFDGAGNLILREIVDPHNKRAVWSFQSDAPNGLTSLKPLWDDQYVVNTWIVQGTGSYVAKVNAVAQDTNPLSPTSVKRYGEVAKNITTGLVRTKDAAQAMASGLLNLTTGIVWSMTMTGPPNPALESSDVVEVERRESYAFGKHILETVTIPVAPGDQMSLQTRQVALA